MKKMDLSVEDYQKVIIDWNQTVHDFPRDKTIHQLFEEQVKRTPNNIAVVFENQQLTYNQLNEEANQLARYIHKQKPGKLVAICMNRSLEMVIAILGILKAGRAYVPMDPNYPQERIDYILSDTKASLVLDNSIKNKPYQRESKQNLISLVGSSDLAYVIYTSGTTGKPKGVMVEHKDFVFYQCSFHALVNQGPPLISAFTLSYCFDASLPTLFSSLLSGGKVIVTNDLLDMLSIDYFKQLREHGVNVIRLTPSLLSGVIDELLEYKHPLTIVLGGETYDERLITRILSHSAIILYNQYGPTEAVVGSTVTKLTADAHRQVIGKQYPGKLIYVLDGYLNPIPIGEIGELYIGGAGLARGYLNQPELTTERFIKNPFSEGRLYKTGDLVRWLSDGNLEYIGRNDFQVKIRGYRIELGEIEHALKRYADVNEAFVKVFEDKLIAYIVAHDFIFITELNAFLTEILPEYMVPAHYVFIEKIPLTINGKLDRNALPLPDFTRSQNQYIGPRNHLEATIARVWQSVLKLDKIGIQDDFFRLGGDSIQIIQMSARLQREGVDIRASDLFTYRTIQKLAENTNQSKPVYAEQGELTGSFDLLPIQQWFFARHLKHPNHWNQSFIVRTPELSVTRLTEILPALMERHDVLRLRFNDGQQIYTDNLNAPTIKTAKDFESCTAWQSHFSLSEGPLWQMGYIEGGYLFFAAHHLIIDTVSWRILMDDIRRLYEGGSLGLKSSSYRQWVTTVLDYPNQYPGERDYWLSQDAPNPLVPLTNKLSFVDCELDETLTQQLLTQAHKTYHTEINDLLLTALAYALYDWTGQTIHGITLEGHGRESIDDTVDVSQTVGWFTTHFPVKIGIKESLSESIQCLKEHLRKIPNKGIGFGAFFNEAKLPDITFNYLGQFDNQTGVWQLADKPSGQSVHPKNAESRFLSITGLVVNHSLHFNITTHTEDVLIIAGAFEARLTQIIQHCIAEDRSYYTPSDFNTVTLSRNLLDTLQTKDSGIEAIYKANSLQQGFIYHTISQANDDAYRVQLLLDYHNPINIKAYKTAWEMAIQTYPILRTYFNWDEDIIQIITQRGHLDFTYHDTVSSVEAIQQADRAIVFDLQRPTPLRIHLMKHDENHYTLLKSNHHIISDGWSGPILLSRVHEYYQALIQHITPQIVPDTAYLQAQAYIAANKNRAQAYWQNQLQAVKQANDLNAFLSRSTNLEQALVLSTPKEVATQLVIPKSFLQQHGLTLHVLAQFAWHKLIHTYTRDEKTIVGTTLSGRALPIPNIDSSVGLYINTLPIVIDWANKQTIMEQLKQIEADVLAMNEYSFAELATLQKEGDRLFYSLFVFENNPVEETHQEASLQVRFRGAIEKLDYPFGVMVYESSHGLHVTLKYDGDYLEDSKAQQLLAQFKLIFEQIQEQHTQPHHALNLLTKTEYQQVVIDWNKTEKAYPKDKTIHQLFEEQVKKTPNNIAVVFEDQQLTYKQLNEKSNQLARYIRKQNPGELVAICMDRSLDMIIAILGILKAGCAYVPIDPNYPQERIDYILEDTRASLILDNRFKDKPYKQQSKKNPAFIVRPNNLAYVIYTSGTTGKPKGVAVEHVSVINTIMNLHEVYRLSSQSRVSEYCAYVFDVSISETLISLFSGAALYVLSEEVRKDTQALVMYLEKNHITHAYLPPAILSVMSGENLSELECIIYAGEPCTQEAASYWSQKVRLYNYYGPTESTIYSAGTLVNKANAHSIGKPIQNTLVYVLDPNHHPLPIGVIGELYIGGAGLARGYLYQPELTNERFIKNPFSEGRLYKTGDLVRWLSDGNLEYIGRNDFQVKIRGYRIELGEIEHALSMHPDIKQCVVLTYDNKLIAYYVGQTTEDLYDYLSKKLPDYMIPHVFIAMELFPLTINGKLDRKALPSPDFTQNQNQYTAPRDEIESIVCQIWQQTLNISLIGVENDFFRLGGHSILAIQVTHKMSRSLKRNVLVADIFKHRTIAKLCAVLKGHETLQNIMPVKENPSPLSFAQERLWFIEQYEGGTDAYHIPLLLRKDDHIVASLQRVIQRHAILRTRFVINENGQYLQDVHNEVLPIEENINPDEFIHRIFDLTQGHPLRAGLYEDKLLIVFHHIAFDEWSGSVLQKELQNPDLPPLEIQYQDFAVWQRELIESRQEELGAYWKTKLADIVPLQMPTDYPRPVNIDYTGASVAFELPNELKALSVEYNVTHYTMLLAGLAITLSRYTGQTDLTIGTPVANRQHPALENLIGFFVNTLVLRIQLNPNHMLSEAVRQLQDDLVEAQLYQDMPFEKLVDELGVERDTSRHPVFQVMYVVQYSDEDDIDEGEQEDNISFNYDVAKFDLSIFLHITPSHIKGSINYATSLFKQETMERFVAHYQQILSSMLVRKDKAIGTYPILTQTEYQQIVIDGNKTEKAYPKDKAIHQLFEEQVKRTPNHIAVVFEDQQLTYKQLNEEANQLARYIRKQNPGELVAICMGRSLEMIVAILGILKAGCAYVPIDPNYPQERIDYLLADTKARLVLDHTLKDKSYKQESKKNLTTIVSPNDLAYVIYTSGTTGRPKGVMIPHSGIVNRLHWMQQQYLLDENDVVLHKTPYHFDVSVWELLWAHQHGAKLVIAKPDGHKDSDYLHQLMLGHHVTIVHFVPSMLSAFTQTALTLPSTLRYIFCSGEALSAAQVNAAYAISGSLLKIHNLYGPTEASIDSTAFVCERNLDVVCIGKPIQNTQVYVLDQRLAPLPVGAIGELYIGGAGLARGYLNQPELTSERFIKNPFGEGRLYKTGDLVRWLSDGNLEYIGRNDFQVKIRGYRIELGEIEHALGTHPDIKQCVVLAHENKLIAYYVGQASGDLNDYLSKTLPDYMMPAAFIAMESFPLTINGKLDRKALPSPDFTQNQEQYIAPRNHLETAIAKIWQSVLQLEQIGIQDDFFRLGGDSIQSIQVSSRLQREGLDIRVRDIFTYRTIQALVGSISINKPVYAEQGLLTGSFDLLPIQDWFFASHFKHPNHWNQSFVVRTPELSVARLTGILPSLMKRHDVLRLCFKDGQQIYTDNLNAPAIKTAKDFESCTAWQSHFNLSKGPLWQMGYIEGGYLFFAAHHLIIDAVSWRILMDDIQRLYEGGSLGLKSSSYRQWVTAVQDYPNQHPDERDYWLSQEAFNPPMTLTSKLSFADCELDEALTQQLLTQASKTYHTEINDLLLTALAYALYDWTGQTTHGITLEGHGRESIDKMVDVLRTVGWFTTQYPVKLDIKESLSESIRCLKEHLHAIPNKGIGFGAFFEGAKLPDITFNYLGQFDNQAGVWQLADKPSGESLHPENTEASLLNVNGLVVNHRLHFNIATYTEDAIKIANAFKTRLTEIIEHCIAEDRSYYTPSDFNTVTLSRNLLDTLQTKDLAIEAIYKANSLQQGFIYHTLSQASDDAYRVQLLLDYHNPINLEAYRQAWELAIQTYPILRTYFNWDEDIIQIITQQGHLNFTYHDTVSSVEAIQQADRAVAFDLQQPTPLRIHLMKHSENHYTLLKSEHHIIADGWSGPILLSRVHDYYRALIQHIAPQVVPDSAYLQAQAYIAANKNRAEVYWRTQLQTIEHANELTAFLSYATNLEQARIVNTPRESTIQLSIPKGFLQQHGLTLHVLAQFTWHKLIHTYTQDEKTIVGTTVSGRALPILNIESSVGLYINTLPLVIDWTSKQTILEQLKAIEADVLAMNEYSFAELATLQKDGARLFHSLFVFENYPADEMAETVNQDASLQLRFREAIEKVDYPFGIMAYENNQRLNVTLKYDGDYLEDIRAQQLLAQFELIFEQISEHYTQSHYALNLLTKAEYQQIVIDWNKTEKAYPKDKTIHQLFEEQVKKTPNNIAVVFEDQQLTYKQLNEEANQLARYIQKQNPGELVAICMDRSLEMMVAIIGVLKAGCAYVPIDPNYPQERIDYILEDTKVSLILDNRLKDKPYKQESKKNLVIIVSSCDLAYVIYTSGTTGKPKGVSISHRNALNTLHAINEQFHVNEQDKVLAISELHFDLSVYDILGLLIAGGQVVIPAHSKEPKHWCELIRTHRITLWNSVPALMQLLLNEAEDTALSLRAILLSGDEISLTLATQVRQRLPEASLMSLGGATEGSIWSIWYPIEAINPVWMSIPYGRALPNQQMYVLDSALNPCPIGARGEICIGGTGVAQGYWNNEEKTRQQFIQHHTLGCIYRTGDLGAWHQDGYIQYHGRNDFQVKIRGYRIELGEIEHVLAAHPDIKQCVVLAHEKKLIAYYVGQVLEDLNDYLNKTLPEYMIPQAFIAMEFFPLTINGKLDRKALPLPDFTQNQNQYIAPRDEIETMVCSIWQQILNIPQVGIEDDFFRLGGHSILAIQVTHKMSRALKRNVLVADIFKHRTIVKLCAILKGQEALQSIMPIQANPSPLSYAQERVWFIEQYEGGTDAYHIPLLLRRDDNLITLLQRVIQRHAILRTRFVINENGQYLQEVHAEALPIEENINPDEFIHRIFDLTQGHPLRAGLYEDKLLIVFHHIAFDEWSGSILQKELQNSDLPPLEIQYKDFAVWQRTVIETRQAELLAYWKTKLADITPLQMPTDYPRPVTIDYTGASIEFELPNALKVLSTEYNVTHYTTLLAGLAITLSRYTGQTDLTIGTPMANRQHPQLENLIGFFVNTLALRIQLDPNHMLSQAIHQIQDDLIEAQLYQDLPFEKLVDELSVERDMSRHPVFQVIYTVQYSDEEDKNEGVTDKENNIKFSYDVAKFDLSISLHITPSQIKGSINYATSLFKQETIERFITHYQQILNAMLVLKDQAIGTYPILTQAEYQKIVIDWNKTEKAYPKDKTIHQLFEEQVKKTPNNIAVVFEDQQLTYKQLNEKSNQLARYIRKQNPGELVAICMDRSLDMIIAILGILKAGCAYVPIDPDYPQERIDYIIEDTKANLVLDNNLKTKLYQQESKKNLTPLSGSNDLAYVIYTSGTTGKPKGVMIMHTSLVNLAFSTINKFSLLTNHEKIAQVCAATFDVFCLDYALAWVRGYELHILSNAARYDPNLITQYIIHHGISYINIPPVLFDQFQSDLLHQLTTLKYLVFGGERLSKRIDSLGLTFNVVNVYGLTECTVDSTNSVYPSNTQHVVTGGNNNIGLAISNTQLYVLDTALKPVPIGAIGELHIGGAGLARGYLHQPALTNERFIQNPFATDEDRTKGYTRLCKTGDLVRWLPDGNLEYIGRNDFQIKIRGYRIELGEIEHVITTHPHIKQCVVLAHDSKLIAYYVGQTTEDLNDYLSKKLPNYMIPNVFIAMKSFPLTINGKLDKKSLPSPDLTQNEMQYVAPENVMEHVIVKVWQSVLNVEKIGLFDNFFKLGGHSILAMQLVVQMNKKLQRYGCQISIADLYIYKCIASLSHIWLDTSRGRSVVKLMNEGPPDKNIYFIHPTLGGCEAYQTIADELTRHYHAIGIDNAYLHYHVTISDLTELTRYYLEQIESAQPFGSEIILCGWSLGGNIALEMAYQLEQQGKTNIKVFLLDTSLSIDSSRGKISNKARLKFRLEERNELKKRGAPDNFIKRQLKCMDIAQQLQNNITNRLSHSEIVLFKADKKDSVLLSEGQIDLTPPDNNISCITNKSIRIIKLDTTHKEIITCIKEITEQLIEHAI